MQCSGSGGCICSCLSISASLKTELFCETSSVFELDNIQKRSNSARLPQCLKLATSKMKQFCQPSFKNGKLNAELAASCQCVFDFSNTCLQSTAPATTS